MILLEAAEIGSGAYGPIVGAICSLGFTVWFGYYMTVKTLPEMNTKFTDALDKISLRDNENMKALWAERREDAREHSAAIKELAAEIRAMIRPQERQ